MKILQRVINHAGELNLEFKEKITIKSKKDIILLSGMDKNPLRPGYLHSVWINPELDQNGNPKQKILVRDKNDELIYIDATFDLEGNLVIPSNVKLYQIPHHLLCHCSSDV
jgi:hypothetical protein